MPNWIKFSEEKPYDYRDNTGWEDDPDVCWFIYVDRYGHKTLSYQPTAFVNGEFQGYENRLLGCSEKLSPYPSDHIEVLYWCKRNEVEKTIMQNFNDWHKAQSYNYQI